MVPPKTMILGPAGRRGTRLKLGSILLTLLMSLLQIAVGLVMVVALSLIVGKLFGAAMGYRSFVAFLLLLCIGWAAVHRKRRHEESP